jgi:hypothetical protein
MHLMVKPDRASMKVENGEGGTLKWLQTSFVSDEIKLNSPNWDRRFPTSRPVGWEGTGSLTMSQSNPKSTIELPVLLDDWSG